MTVLPSTVAGLLSLEGEYYEEALGAFNGDRDVRAQPGIDMMHADFVAVAMHWAL